MKKHSKTNQDVIDLWAKKQEDRDHIIKVTSDAKPDREPANEIFSRRRDLVAMTAKQPLLP